MSDREWPAQITMERKFPGLPRPIYATGIHMDSEYERYVPSQPVQGLVEALEEAVAGSDELFATNRARRLRLATVRARQALADYKNNTEEA